MTDSIERHFSALSRRLISAPHLGGMRLDVLQRYTVIDAEAAWMRKGAAEGWRTPDKLETDVEGFAERH